MLKNKSKSQIILLTSLTPIFCNILWGSAFPVLKIVYWDMNIASSDLGGTITFISLPFFLAGLLLFVYGLLTGVPFFS